MTAFISDSIQQNSAAGGKEQPINVNELIKRVRSSSPETLNQNRGRNECQDQASDDKDKLQLNSLERAFEQFYTEAATMTQSQSQNQTVSVLPQNFEDSLNMDLTCHE